MRKLHKPVPMDRPFAGRSSSPVLEQQPLDPLELAQVVAHQGEAFAAGVGGDVEVIDA
jgi:hypothetical protein